MSLAHEQHRSKSMIFTFSYIAKDKWRVKRLVNNAHDNILQLTQFIKKIINIRKYDNPVPT